MVASRNQGNSSNGKKRSVPFIKIQKPLTDTLVTSTAEVGLPRFADFMFVLLDEPKQRVDLSRIEPVVLRQLNLRFEPKLRFTARTLHMHVHSRLFAGKKIEAVWPLPKDRWTHARPL
jgi:hypothetical protein